MPEKICKFIEDLNAKLIFDKTLLEKPVKRGDTVTVINDEDLIGLANPYQINENYQQCCQSEASNLFASRVRKLDEFVLDKVGNHPDLILTKETFLKSVNLIDIVSANSTRTNCFTKK